MSHQCFEAYNSLSDDNSGRGAWITCGAPGVRENDSKKLLLLLSTDYVDEEEAAVGV